MDLSTALMLSKIFLIISLCISKGSGQNYGLIYAEEKDSPSNNNHFCIVFNPDFHKLPTEKDKKDLKPLNDVTPDVLCSDPAHGESMADTITAVSRGNCTFKEKADVVQRYQGKGALIVSNSGLTEPGANSSEDYNTINITVAMIEQQDFLSMKSLGKNLMVVMYAPQSSRIDYNLIVIWVIAMFTVFVGAYWSGVNMHAKYLRRKQLSMDQDLQGDESKQKEDDDDPNSVEVTPVSVLVFVVLMVAMLLSLYFFYDYLVYVIIGLFTLASSVGLYSCITALLGTLPFRSPCCSRLSCKVPYVSNRVEVRRVILGLLCLGFGIFWAIERNASYAWIMQDILGIAFCLNMIKTIQMPNLKSCTIMLVLLFVYDIFFVFITPLFTKSGHSVMVDVATGGSSKSGEQLPMVLKVPHITNSVMSKCSLPYSLLGFGDILVPALLVAYCHGFDLKVQSRKVYFLATSAAYGVGLIITFVALAFMETGQPALLYLVPCTLLTTVFIGCCRKELKQLWKGEIIEGKPDAVIVDDNTDENEAVTGGALSDEAQQQLLLNR